MNEPQKAPGAPAPVCVFCGEVPWDASADLEARAGEGALAPRRGLAALGRGAERPGGRPAVDHQGVAGDEPRRVAGQEQGGVGDVRGLADLRQRLGVQQEPSAASRLARPFQTIGVETPPGAMAFTRMKSQASCSAAERVRFTTPALAAQ